MGWYDEGRAGAGAHGVGWECRFRPLHFKNLTYQQGGLGVEAGDTLAEVFAQRILREALAVPAGWVGSGLGLGLGVKRSTRARNANSAKSSARPATYSLRQRDFLQLQPGSSPVVGALCLSLRGCFVLRAGSGYAGSRRLLERTGIGGGMAESIPLALALSAPGGCSFGIARGR